MRLSYFSGVVLLFLVACSCEKQELSLPPTQIDDVEVPNDLAPVFQTLLNKVNEIRATGCPCGSEFFPAVAPLSWNAQLATAAERHTTDMANNEHFSHTGTDGSSSGQRATAAGYNWRTVGENIAFGYTSATAVFEGWKSSPGHCRNMMNAAFREMGAAEADNYWTQAFGARLAD
ncbi:MAG: CAP domain-containing protein [Bacteroidota bacterium]